MLEQKNPYVLTTAGKPRLSTNLEFMLLTSHATGTSTTRKSHAHSRVTNEDSIRNAHVRVSSYVSVFRRRGF
jgi:hypothetical protein